jgi:hypothetical protein
MKKYMRGYRAGKRRGRKKYVWHNVDVPHYYKKAVYEVVKQLSGNKSKRDKTKLVINKWKIRNET